MELEAYGRIASAVGKTRGNRASSSKKQQISAFQAQFHRLTRLKPDRLLGAQERYADRFCSSLQPLVQQFRDWGAEIVGDWPNEGYSFEHSAALENGRFLGLILDQRTQGMHSEARMQAWLAQVLPLLREKL